MILVGRSATAWLWNAIAKWAGPWKAQVKSEFLKTLASAMVLLLQCGCGSRSNSPGLAMAPWTVSLRASVPLRLSCGLPDATRNLVITIDRTYRVFSRPRLAILEGAEVPASRAYDLMILYLWNIALGYADGGRLPNGISITERQVGSLPTPKCRHWFLGRSLSYNAKLLMIRDGHSTVLFGTTTAPKDGGAWQALNAGSWPVWWAAVDAKLHLSEIFGGRGVHNLITR